MAPQLNSAKRRKTLLSSAKKTAGRRLMVNPVAGNEVHHYTCEPEMCRNVVKEYGDVTTYPCGATSVVDPHFSNGRCINCDAVRFVMDTWSLANARVAIEENRRADPVPPLTHAMVLSLIEQLGFQPEDVLRLENDWDPYKPMRKRSRVNNEVVYTAPNTIVQQYNNLEGRLSQKRGSRPMFEFGEFNPEGDDPMEASVRYRTENTKNEMMLHIIFTALADGLINQEWLNLAISNYGIVRMTNGRWEDMSSASGIDVQELHQKFQLQGLLYSQEVNEANYKYSPKRLHDVNAGIVGGLPVHSHAVRMTAINGNNNAANANGHGNANGTGPQIPDNLANVTQSP